MKNPCPDRPALLRARPLLLLPLAMLLMTGASSFAANSVSQYGFTWSFSSDRPVGQYCNGDWWVLGPVTITSITPASTTITETLSSGATVQRIVNGTMVNPAPNTQGWDNAVSQAGGTNIFAPYSSNLNVAPSMTGTPLYCPPGTSVVSSVSRAGLPKSTSYTQIEKLAILTVVASAPASGAFRPPPVGTDKTSYWNKSQINYGILRKLVPVASTPSLSSVEASFAIPWTALHEGPTVQSMSPGQMPNYGRDQAQLISNALLSLHLNYTDAQKEVLFIRLIQYGIDVYGTVKRGTVFRDLGGLNVGRKAPMVLAGLALNDANIKEWADAGKHFVFHEDRQTFIVRQSDVGRVMYSADGRLRETYLQEHVGLPEWGEQHILDPRRDGSNWGVLYRHSNGGPVLGNALGILLIDGGRAVWNWEPFFDYEDRFWAIEKDGQYSTLPNAINSFTFNMWNAYRSSGTTNPPPPPPPPQEYAIGDRIELLVRANVRSSAEILATNKLGEQEAGALGTIIDGPVQAGGITWWMVNYDTGVDGWTGGDNFRKSTVPATTSPSAPKGLRVKP